MTAAIALSARKESTKDSVSTPHSSGRPLAAWQELNSRLRRLPPNASERNGDQNGSLLYRARSVLALNVLSGGAGIALAISLGSLECLPTPHDRSIA